MEGGAGQITLLRNAFLAAAKAWVLALVDMTRIKCQCQACVKKASLHYHLKPSMPGVAQAHLCVTFSLVQLRTVVGPGSALTAMLQLLLCSTYTLLCSHSDQCPAIRNSKNGERVQQFLPSSCTCLCWFRELTELALWVSTAWKTFVCFLVSKLHLLSF